MSVDVQTADEYFDPPETEIYPEVQAGAEWWGEILKRPAPQDNGDLFQSAFAQLVADAIGRPSPEQIERFVRWLAWGFQTSRIVSWDPRERHWGGASRVISIDYAPDTLLVLAACRAGITGCIDPLFPIKTVMWINPGSVKVRCGYSGAVTTIYQGDEE